MGGRRFFAVCVVLLGFMAWLAPSTAAAPHNDGAACRQEVRDQLIAASSEGTMGDFNSDVLMGNEPNPTNVDSDLDLGPNEVNAEDPGSVAGYVVPSAAPGPKTMSGGSYGPSDMQQFIKATCGN